jgi:osmotically-inducible protein OsmY
MKRLILALALAAVSSWGCSGQFWGGAAAGALGAGAGYEIQSKRQMDRLEDDYKSGKVDRREYETRKQQIEKGSIIY